MATIFARYSDGGCECWELPPSPAYDVEGQNGGVGYVSHVPGYGHVRLCLGGHDTVLVAVADDGGKEPMTVTLWPDERRAGVRWRDVTDALSAWADHGLDELLFDGERMWPRPAVDGV